MSKLFYGVAYNSRREHKTVVNGANTSAYKTWRRMLKRCYCTKYHEKSPTYIGCSVDNEWLDFQDFADWFESHEYSCRGYQLDKDLLIPGNKVYGPETCCFVPQQLNSLLNDSGAARGQYLQGVYFHKGSNKFVAQIGINGKNKRLGGFDTEQEAYLAYKEAKEGHVKEKALEWQDGIANEIYEALMTWKLDPK